jgi:hypothetical protein
MSEVRTMQYVWNEAEGEDRRTSWQYYVLAQSPLHLNQFNQDDAALEGVDEEMNKPLGNYEGLTYWHESPFVGAKIRIKRAGQHIDDLEEIARELPKRRGYGFVVCKPINGKIDIIYMPNNRVPIEYGAVVGDAIHNIRAALDYAAIIITCPPFGTGDRKRAYFPVGATEPEFKKALAEKMKGATPHAQQLVSDLEPYAGGKHSIQSLHALDILDKHKLILATSSQLHVDELGYRIGDNQFSLTETDFHPNADGSNFTSTIDCQGNDPEKFKLGDNFKASFTMVFDKDQPLTGEPIVDSLRTFCGVANGFIEKCEKSFHTA